MKQTIGALGVAAAVLLVSGIIVRSHTQEGDLGAILGETRRALGGDALARIKTFTAAGRTRRLQGDGLVSIEVVVLAELPDKYVRREEVPARESGPTLRGFNGDRLIEQPASAASRGRNAGASQVPPPPSAAANVPRPASATTGGDPRQPASAGRGTTAFLPPRADPLSIVKQDFVVLTLGMFGASFSGYPVTFGWVGEAQAPQGLADVLSVSGPGGSYVALRLFISRQSRLPTMVTWMMAPTNVIVTAPGQATPTAPPGTVLVQGPPLPSATASKEDVTTFTRTLGELRRKAQSTLLEYRVYYADYRLVGGVQWPHRLRRAIGTETIEETNLDSFEVNPKIDPRRFEVSQ